MKTKILLFVVMLIFSVATMADNYNQKGKIIKVPRDYATIQAAIDAADNFDMVLVAEGTYYENIRFNGKSITVASWYYIDHSASHIRKTIIHGLVHPGAAVAATVMFTDGEDKSSVLAGFTITGGHGVMNETHQKRCGGGVYIYNSGCTLLNNIISGNSVVGDKVAGGGICCLSDDGLEHYTVIESNIIRNNVVESDGRIALGGGIAAFMNANILNNVIEGNVCRNILGQANGAGIYIEELAGNNDMSVMRNNTILNNQLEGNYTAKGGGVAVYYVPVEFVSNLISNNQVTAAGTARGGGVYVYKSSTGIVFNDNRIIENRCYGSYAYGGALYIRQCGETDIHNNKFIRNRTVTEESAYGGALWITQSSAALSLKENGFIGNEAGDMSFGGALGIYSTDANTVVLDKNRFLDNTAREGGALWTYNTYDLNLCNNLFLRNIASYLGGALKLNKYDESEQYLSPDERVVGSDNAREFLRPVMSNNNFVMNSAFKGGAVCSDMGWYTPVIFNSIFCTNSAFVADDLKTLSDDPFAVYNCLINTDELNTPWTGADNIFCDPGFDGDCEHLCENSLCVNAGTEVLYYDHKWYHCVGYDIDNERRPYADTEVDIGVDESEVMFTGLSDNIVKTFEMKVFPNPVVQHATIRFALSEDAYAQVVVFNATGKQEETLLSANLQAGTQTITWDAGKLNRGIHYVKLAVGKQIYTQKVVVMH